MISKTWILNLVIVTGALASTALGLTLFPRHLIDRTIRESHEIHAAFKDAANYTTAFNQKNQRLPSSEEFESSSASKLNWHSLGITIETTDLPSETKLMKQEVYRLKLWRGEWFE